MRLSIRLDGSAGAIEVDVRPNSDPRSLGCDEDNLGFPVCTATVSYDGTGYSAMFGWVQLVRSLQRFSWSFTIRAARVELAAVSALPPDAWTQHLPYLGATYPAWRFTPAKAWG